VLLTSRKVQTLTQELQGQAAAVSADVPCNTCDGENTFCAASDTEEQELQVLNVACFTRTKVVVPLQHLRCREHVLCGFRAARGGGEGAADAHCVPCFTSTKVQILTLAELQGHVLGALGKPFFFLNLLG
jgi:hypothetical protein